MNEIDLAYTQAPTGLIMPAMPQLITTSVYGIAALIFVIFAIRLAIKQKSAVPTYLLIGSMLTLYLEPVVDLLGNAVHPQIGQFNVITTNGHPVPVAVLIGYIWYFAALPLLCYQKILDQSLSQNFVWKSFAGVIISAALVEQIPLYFGVWEYYGYQPFKIGFMPSWWFFANTAAVILPFLSIYALMPKLRGAQQIIICFIMPCAAFMGHAGAGWPMYNALGTDTETTSSTLIQFASIASSLFAILIVWTYMQMINLPKSSKN